MADASGSPILHTTGGEMPDSSKAAQAGRLIEADASALGYYKNAFRWVGLGLGVGAVAAIGFGIYYYYFRRNTEHLESA